MDVKRDRTENLVLNMIEKSWVQISLPIGLFHNQDDRKEEQLQNLPSPPSPNPTSSNLPWSFWSRWCPEHVLSRPGFVLACIRGSSRRCGSSRSSRPRSRCPRRRGPRRPPFLCDYLKERNEQVARLTLVNCWTLVASAKKYNFVLKRQITKSATDSRGNTKNIKDYFSFSSAIRVERVWNAHTHTHTHTLSLSPK